MEEEKGLLLRAAGQAVACQTGEIGLQLDVPARNGVQKCHPAWAVAARAGTRDLGQKKVSRVRLQISGFKIQNAGRGIQQHRMLIECIRRPRDCRVAGDDAMYRLHGLAAGQTTRVWGLFERRRFGPADEPDCVEGSASLFACPTNTFPIEPGPPDGYVFPILAVQFGETAGEKVITRRGWRNAHIA